MKRPTIADIAQRAGVTKAAVSFALNGQPGVSAATRERILAIAQEVGFQPNSAARALTDTGRFMGQDVSLRWIYVHLIEEYARHNGHADLIRERIDGTTGV